MCLDCQIEHTHFGFMIGTYYRTLSENICKEHTQRIRLVTQRSFSGLY
jgi:hypothetical protein